MSKTYTRATILGCGSSGGVPRINGDWGICDPANPKNRRTRCSLLVERWEGQAEAPPEHERTIIFIDTAPDLREQILRTDIKHVDAVFFTHEHADQCHGIDDLRAIAYQMRRLIPAYMNAATGRDLMNKFEYIFQTPKGLSHPPILDKKPYITNGKTTEITGPGGSIKVTSFGVDHGDADAVGYRFGPFGYAPDACGLSEAGYEILDGVECFIVDALRYHTHPTHAHADNTLSWLAKLCVSRGVLTNLHIDMDYDILSAELPGKIEPAFDGMRIKLK